MAPNLSVPFFLPARKSRARPEAARAHPFLGRTVAEIEDLNRDERLYLYRRTRELKAAMAGDDRRTLESFRIGDPDFGLYEVFLENSTRTRESFKNAAHFHRIKFSELNAATSSFNKAESYADTFANLVGYGNRVFVIRSAVEGVCRHLQRATERYRERNNVPWPVAFINAGDGRHEHPTQELLDEFTFLEDRAWSTDRIHLSLVGDLYHGRTVHSKVNGLRLFSAVEVDLVAPPELAMPRHYVERMRANGFAVREFASIEQYLEHGGAIAPQWYFTRPQLERMGERVLRRQDELRAAVTFDPQHVGRLPRGTRFYHPLPRHRQFPTIPTALDNTELNAWERQSANGWVVRIALLAMIAGRIGADYTGPVGPPEQLERECFREVDVDMPEAQRPRSAHYCEGIRPITDGLVLDHICAGESPEVIRAHINTLVRVLRLHGRGGEWVAAGADGKSKGLLFRPGCEPPTDALLRTMAAVVPGATVNVIKTSRVQRKVRLVAPDRIAEIAELGCRNTACISHADNGEGIGATFRRTGAQTYECEYCGTAHSFKEVWK